MWWKTSKPKTVRSRGKLPPELVDRIIDFLHDEPKALAACSLVARSWTTTSRYHRFSWVRLTSNEDWAKFDRLIKISPSMSAHMRGVTIDVTGAHSARWMSVCPGFTSLEHITMFGAIIPPWQSEAAAISSVAHKITSFTLNAAFVSRYDFWPTIRMFPNLVALHPFGARYVTELATLQSPSLPCYSPPIAFVSVTTLGQENLLDDFCNPPYPLSSLSTLDIRDDNLEKTGGLQTLAETYAGQITKIRLHVRSSSHLCTSLGCFHPFTPYSCTVLDSPDYISCFTNLRHLTFTDLNPTQKDHYEHTRKSFAWVNGAIAAIQSPITHLTFEILVRRSADLYAMDWKAIDVLISSRGSLRSLVQVLVVFLDRLEDEDWDSKSTAHPVTVRGLMPLTATMGLLKIATRGPRIYP